MIKVGQIYECVDSQVGLEKVVVTHVYCANIIDYILDNGICVCQDSPHFLKKNRKLIAEYPTWQDAVNSPEFRGENK